MKNTNKNTNANNTTMWDITNNQTNNTTMTQKFTIKNSPVYVTGDLASTCWNVKVARYRGDHFEYNHYQWVGTFEEITSELGGSPCHTITMVATTQEQWELEWKREQEEREFWDSYYKELEEKKEEDDWVWELTFDGSISATESIPVAIEPKSPKTYLARYGSCSHCPVNQYCGTMISSMRLCNSYKNK